MVTSKLRSFLSISILIFFLVSCVGASDSTKSATLVPFGISDRSVSFLVIGDWGRRGKENQQEVANQMGIYGAQINSSFTISVGDNFYETGVTSTSDSHWKETFENVFTAPVLQKRWYVTLGNHDYAGSVQAQVDYTKLSKRWYMPNTYFSETIAVDDTTKALFVFLDTNPFVNKYYSKAVWNRNYNEIVKQDTLAQFRWCDSVLAHSNAQWKILVGHHPVYSGSTYHGDTPEMIEKILPLIKKYHVQVFLCGHDHDLQHLKPNNESTDYFISGGGSSVRPTKMKPFSRFGEGISGFLAATLSNKTMSVNFIDYNGNILYRTEVNR